MVMVEQRNRDGGTVKKRDGKTVELIWKSDCGTENSYGGRGQQRWWTSGTIMVEQWNRYDGKVQQ